MEHMIFGLVLTIAVTVGIAVLILLFERRRARDIAQDSQRLRPVEERRPEERR
jgi:hypothetical protein